MGSKISRTAYKPRERATDTKELPLLDDVIKSLGGGIKGFVVERGDK